MSDDLVKRLLANGLDECDDAVAHIEALQAEIARLCEALFAIEVYGCDTLSGPVPPTRHDLIWARDGIREMVRRARAALSASTTANLTAKTAPEAPGMTRPGNVTHET